MSDIINGDIINGGIVLTGDRPTGCLHLGHYVGSLKNRLILQENNEVFIVVADTQVINNDITKAKDVKKNTIEVMKDYLSIGLNPNKVTFFLQSEILELFELTNYLSNLVTLPQVMRNPTIKAENEIYNKSLTMGFLNYPVSQAADIILLNGEYVPVGEDQLPILEFSNDLIEKFNYTFETDLFKKIKPIISDNSRLLGLDGKNKMSKSLGNAISLSDNEKLVNEKIYQMFTDPDHIKISDPGKIEGNVVFMFLDIFHKDKSEIDLLKLKYQEGGLGDVFLKKMLMKDLKDFLDPIREQRNALTDEYVLNILQEGTMKVKSIAKKRMDVIKSLIFK
jgi:tryptophanyl-tRNA synthetase